MSECQVCLKTLPEGTEECPHCTGIIDKLTKVIGGGSVSDLFVKCEKCDGDGEIREPGPMIQGMQSHVVGGCEACEGEGYVPAVPPKGPPGDGEYTIDLHKICRARAEGLEEEVARLRESEEGTSRAYQKAQFDRNAAEEGVNKLEAEVTQQKKILDVWSEALASIHLSHPHLVGKATLMAEEANGEGECIDCNQPPTKDTGARCCE